MQRRKFIGLSAGGAFLAIAGTAYVLSDNRNLLRTDIRPGGNDPDSLQPDENEILALASLAPSGHNTQPWFIHALEPYHWIIGNDQAKWLPAVDPHQRETILSLGAFLQNLEYAASDLGYACRWTLLASAPQDERVMEVQLSKIGSRTSAHIEAIKRRRTVRGGFQQRELSKDDLAHLVAAEPTFFHYLPASGKEARFISEQTIEANRLQSYRDLAQQELADWIRFSSKEARKHRDGLTTAGMEIEGIAGWVVRNFYDTGDVLKTSFRERGIANVRKQVAETAGWILMTSPNDSVESLLKTGRRMQRLFLKVRERKIAIHPMTQILEEPSTRLTLHSAIGIGENIEFILRVGYVENYPPPVSLRRPVAWFVRK